MDPRQSPPFALRLFYRTGAFHRLDEFSSPTLPPYLTIHAWPSSTLLDLSHYIVANSPSLLPDPCIGTRLSFRLIFPDARHSNTGTNNRNASGAASSFLHGGTGGSSNLNSNRSGGGMTPRFLVKDLGSIVLGDGGPGLDPADAEVPKTLHDDATTPASLDGGGDAEKSLMSARFVVGDYVSVAILPPLSDGSIAPPGSARTGRGAGAGEAGSAVGRNPPPLLGRDRMENGHGRGPRHESRGGRRGAGAGGGAGSDGFSRNGGVPMGEWRRGERLPDGPAHYRGGRGGVLVGDWRRGENLPDAPGGRTRGRGRF
ncbi:Sin3 associated polypeptide p18-domain-containing protein [Xylariales sp. PMI_506]|nr:Sin3 associated polypeptide p18-domain-containing protein [Xylariales sp. PMI_506]